MKPFAIGTQVRFKDNFKHAAHGVGEVVDAWRSWFACRNCYAMVDRNDLVCAECSHEINKCWQQVEVEDEFGPYMACKLLPNPFQVDGKGVFEIEFPSGEVKPIDKCWLRKI